MKIYFLQLSLNFTIQFENDYYMKYSTVEFQYLNVSKQASDLMIKNRVHMRHTIVKFDKSTISLISKFFF